jgi:hypothetical protein
MTPLTFTLYTGGISASIQGLSLYTGTYEIKSIHTHTKELDDGKPIKVVR